jgi:hypothetical protein
MQRRFPGTDVEVGMDYGDYIETRVRQLAKEDRERRGISSVSSPEAQRLMGEIRRQWAWPELAAVAAAALLLVVGLATP